MCPPRVRLRGMRSLALGALVVLALACDKPRATPEPLVLAPAASALVPAETVLPSAPPSFAGDDAQDLVAGADAGAPTVKERQANAAAANAFAVALYRELRSTKGNLLASGTSLRLACGMAHLGAAGDTAAEMATALRMDPDPIRAAALARSERSDWASVTDSQLSVANRLWVANGFPIRPNYLAMVADAYGAPAEALDFAGASEASRQAINGWVARETKGKIPELIDEIDSSTKAIITNAIYFKGSWTETFAKSETVEEPFHLDAEKTVPVAMMHEHRALRFAAVGGVRVLQKPYGKSGRMAMLFVLPEAEGGLARIEESLTEAKLRSWVGALAQERVVVALPKFKIERTISLRPVLEKLGMRHAFEEAQADFSRISGRRLFVSKVVQKALIEVDEEGTVAAAATMVAVGDPWATEPKRFVADHPFLFFLRDTTTGRVLFMGRVVDPKA
jgi:serpin B